MLLKREQAAESFRLGTFNGVFVIALSISLLCVHAGTGRRDKLERDKRDKWSDKLECPFISPLSVKSEGNLQEICLLLRMVSKNVFELGWPQMSRTSRFRQGRIERYQKSQAKVEVSGKICNLSKSTSSMKEKYSQYATILIS